MFKKMIMDGAAGMGIEMSAEQAGKFEIYHHMLVEANARMNLTRVPDDLREAIDRNYLDCISPLSREFPCVKKTQQRYRRQDCTFRPIMKSCFRPVIGSPIRPYSRPSDG